MSRYIKKAIVVDAIQLDSSNNGFTAAEKFCSSKIVKVNNNSVYMKSANGYIVSIPKHGFIVRRFDNTWYACSEKDFHNTFKECKPVAALEKYVSFEAITVGMIGLASDGTVWKCVQRNDAMVTVCRVIVKLSGFSVCYEDARALVADNANELNLESFDINRWKELNNK